MRIGFRDANAEVQLSSSCRGSLRPHAARVSKQSLKLDLNPTAPKPQAKPQEPDLCQVRDACQTYLMSWLAKKREDKGQAVDRVASARGFPVKPAVDLKRRSRRTSIGHDSMFEHCHYLLIVAQTEPNFLEACSTSAGKVLKPFSRTRVGVRVGVYVESTASGALPIDMPRSSGHDPAARRDDCRDGSKSCLRIPAAGGTEDQPAVAKRQHRNRRSSAS